MFKRNTELIEIMGYCDPYTNSQILKAIDKNNSYEVKKFNKINNNNLYLFPGCN